jgi:catechol 2,3-dioxygenase-like lactoylglutathione lyase family enzyme
MDLRPTLDHIVISVPDLDEAVGRFHSLGFTVVEGGTHEDAPTHNALIGLEDATYVELIAFTGGPTDADPGDEAASALGRLVESWRTAGHGLVHFALNPTNIGADIARCNRGGAPYDGPFPGGRVRPDGRQVRWCMGIPHTRSLPFFCGDITPRQYRVPVGASAIHDNGAYGVSEVTVAVPDPAIAETVYAAVLGKEPESDPRGGARFELEDAAVRLVGTGPEESHGISALTLWTSDPARAGLLPSAQTAGAHIELQYRPRSG